MWSFSKAPCMTGATKVTSRPDYSDSPGVSRALSSRRLTAMELRVLIEPQFGASYEQQLSLVQAAERLGFPAVMRSDHVVNTSTMSGLPGPTDAWVTLGALARETRSIRLGTL